MPGLVSDATRIWELNIYWPSGSQCGVWDPKSRGVDIWECIRARESPSPAHASLSRSKLTLPSRHCVPGLGTAQPTLLALRDTSMTTALKRSARPSSHGVASGTPTIPNYDRPHRSQHPRHFSSHPTPSLKAPTPHAPPLTTTQVVYRPSFASRRARPTRTRPQHRRTDGVGHGRGGGAMRRT